MESFAHLTSEEVISTLLHVTFGVGSPLASQGMINSLPTSWRYSGRGRTLNVGGSWKTRKYFILGLMLEGVFHPWSSPVK